MTDLRRGIYRRIYSGFLWGKRINSVSLECEAWFWRLLVVADDFGNLPAEEARLSALTKGARHKLRDSDVAAYCACLEKARLISRYTADGEEFYHIHSFEELQPAPRNGRMIQKYPAYTEQNGAGESGGIRKSPDESGGITPSHSHSHSHTHDHSHCASPQVALHTTPPDKPLRVPVKWTTSGWYGVTDGDKARWKSAFPACDIDRQLAAMDVWLQANPLKARKSNWEKFVVNWLTRSQDRGGDVKSAARTDDLGPEDEGGLSFHRLTPAEARKVADQCEAELAAKERWEAQQKAGVRRAE